MSPDPQRGALIALASLEAAGPARLCALLRDRTPVEAWELVRSGRCGPEAAPGVGPALLASWRQQAATLDPAELARAHDDAGIAVVTPSHATLAAAFLHDPSPPAVMFARGDLAAVDGPSVAIVGTRDCTRAGRDLARIWGRELAEAGVAVVSGLALGIDGAAHGGAVAALAAPPIAVVGSGLDVVYPRQHRQLWDHVADLGLLLTEHPLGTRPKPWHFPARNRVIAALADVVVVVESHASGGSLHTVEEAVARDTDVLAVPGPVRSPASDGTNRLLFEGCAMARSADDILLALARATGWSVPAAAPGGRDVRPVPSDAGRRLLEALGWEAATADQLILRSGLTFGEAAAELLELERTGWVESRGGWYEQIGAERGR